MKTATDPDLKAQATAHNQPSGESPAAAAERMMNESTAWAAWKAMTPAERVQLVQEGRASYFIITAPAGAEIDMDGVRAGRSPMKGSLLRHGKEYRTVTIKRPGFVIVEQKFILDGKTISIGITLVLDSSMGTKS